ncbi:MAG: hypothetical protein SPL71_08655 [Oribacterium sp.]|nr:hypothetical protein [Oribacterium sp.]
MNKIARTLVSLLVIVMVTVSLTGCGKTTYTAASGFFYSSDKGHSYGDGTKEYAVGKTVYMKVKFKVTSNKKKTSQVKVVLSIPNVQNVDAKYMDGQVITPNFDAINNVTTYEFTANAAKEANESECVIQFVPNTPGSVTMKLIYDDNVDPSYDIQSTLEFVEGEQGSTEE